MNLKPAILAVAMICAGCSHLGSSTHTDMTTYYLDPEGKTNSVTVDKGETRLFGFALLDSNQALQKAYNQSGYSSHGQNRYSPGTGVGGLNQSSTGTNLVQILKILEALSAAGAL